MKNGLSLQNFKVVLCTAPNTDSAETLAKGALNNKLVACVNIIEKVRSFYWWEEEIQEDQEMLLIMKTHESKVEELIDWVQKNHPYEVPEVISLPIEAGSLDYLTWISKNIELKTKG